MLNAGPELTNFDVKVNSRMVSELKFGHRSAENMCSYER
jgi:hypothetical protein